MAGELYNTKQELHQLIGATKAIDDLTKQPDHQVRDIIALAKQFHPTALIEFGHAHARSTEEAVAVAR